MIARTRKTKTRSNQDGLAAFVQKKAEIDTMLSRLEALSDDHFNVAPARSLGPCRHLGHHAELLKRVTDWPSTRASTRIGARSPAPAPCGTSPRGSGS